MDKESIIYIFEKEIEWCQKNEPAPVRQLKGAEKPEKAICKMSFIKGLEHAIKSIQKVI